MRKCRLLSKNHYNELKYEISEEPDEPNSTYQLKPHFWVQFEPNLGLNGLTRAPKISNRLKIHNKQLNIVEINQNMQYQKNQMN